MKAVFTEDPITAFYRDANLQDILIHSKHRKIKKMYDVRNVQNMCYICNIFIENEFHHINVDMYVLMKK